ncbi:hypothetical protein WJX73_006643 [Symbiochloris irregularis]|uniref:Uncharacterized protein n=1 Tax=Symbiochloris irregularis TaxID=706552 RepID=A0AAW1PMF7_9CHLO
MVTERKAEIVRLRSLMAAVDEHAGAQEPESTSTALPAPGSLQAPEQQPPDAVSKSMRKTLFTERQCELLAYEYLNLKHRAAGARVPQAEELRGHTWPQLKGKGNHIMSTTRALLAAYSEEELAAWHACSATATVQECEVFFARARNANGQPVQFDAQVLRSSSVFMAAKGSIQAEEQAHQSKGELWAKSMVLN